MNAVNTSLAATFAAIKALPDVCTLATLLGDEEGSASPPAHQPSISKAGENLERIYGYFYEALCQPAVDDALTLKMRTFINQISIIAKVNSEIASIHDLFMTRVLYATKVQNLAPILTYSTADSVFSAAKDGKNKLLLKDIVRRDEDFPLKRLGGFTTKTLAALFGLVFEMGDLKIISRYLDFALKKGLHSTITESLHENPDLSGIFFLGKQLSEFSTHICKVSIEKGDTLHIHEIFLKGIPFFQKAFATSKEVKISTPYPETLRAVLEGEAMPNTFCSLPKDEAIQKLKEVMAITELFGPWELQEKYWNMFAAKIPKLTDIKRKKGHKRRLALYNETGSHFLYEKFVKYLVLAISEPKNRKAVAFAEKEFGARFRRALLLELAKYAEHFVSEEFRGPLSRFLAPLETEKLLPEEQGALDSLSKSLGFQ